MYASAIAIEFWLASCAKQPKPILASVTPTIAPPAEFTPTKTETPMPTATERAIITVDERFKLGNYDAAVDQLTIKVGKELRDLLGYSLLDSGKFSVDIPLAIKSNSLGTEDQFRIFDEGSRNRNSDVVMKAANGRGGSHPNPGYIIALDAYPGKEPKGVAIYTHDVQTFPSPAPTGDLGLDILQWVSKHPDRKDEVKGKTAEFSTDKGISFEGEIVHAGYVSQYFWTGGDGKNSPFRTFTSGDNILFADSEALGIPQDVVKGLAEDEYLIVIDSCLGGDPGETTESINENSKNRLVLVFKVKIK